MLEIYLDPCTCNSRKVLAGLDLLGTQYHLNHVSYLENAALFVPIVLRARLVNNSQQHHLYGQCVIANSMVF
jgi:hypothetical protein